MTAVVRIREADSDTVLASFPLTAMSAAGVSRDKLNSLTPQGLMPGAKTSASTTLKNSHNLACKLIHPPTNTLATPMLKDLRSPYRLLREIRQQFFVDGVVSQRYRRARTGRVRDGPRPNARLAHKLGGDG